MREETFHDIVKCVETSDHTFISLNKSYPDKSIAWLIADHLIRSELGNKQILPVVVDGQSVRPPHYSIEVAAPDLFKAPIDQDTHQIVIIFDGLPMDSKTRMHLILSEIANHPKAKFVYVDRMEANFFLHSEFSTTVGAKAYRLSDISFYQISHSLQRNFEMEGQESEVVAHRLRDTFKKFQLDAHPSYFAGIPKETLSALVQANKRSELMQIGVDGFLTFLVAGDPADIILSRTTRAKFLRKLVVQMRTEKKEFTEADLITFTNEFSKKYDFDIRAIDFISEFIKFGILYCDGNVIRVAIPFIESFLLAQELSTNPTLASKYFSLIDPEFDIAAFDLYCEIGPSEDVINSVESHLEEILSHQDLLTNRHILLGNEIDPASLMSTRKLRQLTSKIKTASSDIIEGKSNIGEKQKLLDFSEKISRAVSKSTGAAFEDDSPLELSAAEPSEAIAQEDEAERKMREVAEKVSQLSLATTVGAILIGHGAEHMDAISKRRLAKLVIRSASTLIDSWTRLHHSINFTEIKAQLTSEVTIEKMQAESSTSLSKREIVDIINDLADMMRFMLLSVPFRRVVDVLVEHAKNPVLEKSISSIELGEEFSELIRAVWISDLELKDGDKLLKEAVKKLPKSSLLRICLSEHILKRVYWDHSVKPSRLKLLEIASDILFAINLTVDKKEYKAAIEGGGKKK